jgi:hypothetical protein
MRSEPFATRPEESGSVQFAHRYPGLDIPMVHRGLQHKVRPPHFDCPPRNWPLVAGRGQISIVNRIGIADIELERRSNDRHTEL